ncbi:MAG: diguanylate cyclase [Deltaproteobacteria bacterium]|nr:diguanylate cyclase [Deltaproteobacteria bacterium]
MRILVADDDPVTRLLVKSHLIQWGHEVILCSDGAMAWEHLQQEDSPKLAILDWMMPQKDGLQICTDLRNCRKEPYVYIILLTSKSGKDDVVKGLEAGADDYIIKPFDYNEFRTRVRAGARIVQLQDDLMAALKVSEFQAAHDALTRLLNRSAVLNILEKELMRSKREGAAVSVVMVDIDNFKRINDQHGHTTGDAVLREVAKRLTASMRPYDSCGRYGGEEFLIVIPGCKQDVARNVAERLRDTFAKKPIDTSEGLFGVTISLGVSTATEDEVVNMDSLIRSADEALYLAKKLGRNRVESSS